MVKSKAYSKFCDKRFLCYAKKKGKLHKVYKIPKNADLLFFFSNKMDILQ